LENTIHEIKRKEGINYLKSQAKSLFDAKGFLKEGFYKIEKVVD